MRCSVNATSGSPTPSPRRPAWVSLPAEPGSVDTSLAREPPALPTSAPSGSRTALSLPCRLRLLLPCCSRHPTVRSPYSLARISLPTLLRRIFLPLVPGMPRRSALLPQASPASGKRQSLDPKVSAFLVHPANCSIYSSLSLFGPSPANGGCRVGGGAHLSGLASVRRSNPVCSFPAPGFHKSMLSIEPGKGSMQQDLPVPFRHITSSQAAFSSHSTAISYGAVTRAAGRSSDPVD